MTNLTATASWDPVPQIDISTLLLGGPGGPLNAPAQALLNRLTMLANSRVLDTIAVLKTVDHTAHTRVFVVGYYAAGDGGGGEYWYDPTDTSSSDDGGSVIIANDGARWKLAAGHGVTTKQFGAKHDGSTNDTAGLQACENFCQATGATMNISPGVAMFTTLTISGSIRIRGTMGGVLKQMVTVGNTFSITGSGITVDIDGVTFDGQQSSQVALSTNDVIHSTATGVANGKPFYLTVTNCDFLNTPYRGVAVYGANDNTKRQVARITGNRFRNGSINATNTAYSPIDIHMVDQVEFFIDDNDFEFDVAPTLTGGAGRSAVVSAETQTTTAYYTKATVTNNRINYRGVNELASLGAIDLYIWTGNAVVAFNEIRNSTAAAIKFKGNSPNISIHTNKIDGCYMTGGQITATSAITYSNPNYGSSAHQQLIQSNQISNWAAGGSSGVISIQSFDGTTYSKNIAVLDNQMWNCSGLVGIDVNSAQDVTVSRNDIDAGGNITLGVRMLNCDGLIRVFTNKIRGTTSYMVYNDMPATTTQDLEMNDNKLLGNTGTYSVYAKCRQVIAQKNFVSGGVHGMRFDTVQSAIFNDNILANMSGTVGFSLPGTVVNLIARDNSIVDSASITTNALTYSGTPTLLINTGNTWNGQVTQGSASPSTGTWAVGDYCRNTAPTSTSVAGWVCTTAGSPGVWTGIALP